MKNEIDVLEKLIEEIKSLRSAFMIEDIPNYGDVMSMEDFIKNCECGGFIDYDGFAHPILNDKMIGGIIIRPSRIKEWPCLKFKKVIWFNR